MAGRTYDFWLLDLDGTVVDIEREYIYDVFDEVGSRLGHGFTRRAAERCWYGTGTARADVLADAGLSAERFWEVFHDVEDPRARAAATFVYEDAADAVPRADVPVGVVTHCQEYLTEPIIEALDIGDWFDAVVCCSDETGWKPDPTPVELAMGEIGVTTDGHRGFLAGDTPQDVDAALNAGIDAVHVARDRHDPAGIGDGSHERIAGLTDLDA